MTEIWITRTTLKRVVLSSRPPIHDRWVVDELMGWFRLHKRTKWARYIDLPLARQVFGSIPKFGAPPVRRVLT